MHDKRRVSVEKIAAALSVLLAAFSLSIAGCSYHDSQIATELSRRTFDITALPSLTLSCVFDKADLKRKPFSQHIVYMAPAGIDKSTVDTDFSSLSSMRLDLDMTGLDDVWACTLHSYSKLPLLNVALRFPVLVSDRPSADQTPNYVVCLNEIPAVPVDGDFKFVLTNGSNQQAMLFAPLPAMVTVPSLGRVPAKITLVGLEDPFKEFLFRPLPVGFLEKHMKPMKHIKDRQISDTERLHCAREQDKHDQEFQEMQDDEERLFRS